MQSHSNTRSLATRTCEQCGQSFPISVYEIERGGGRFCGKSCATKYKWRFNPPPRPIVPPLMDRLWAKVVKTDGCWIWTGQKTPDGYGRIRQDGLKKMVHRIVYASLNGPIPADMAVCHSCDTPGCCRPDHLFLGSIAENNHDRNQKGRTAKGDRHSSHLYPDAIRRGEAISHSKLTDACVRAMRERFARGETYSALGREFGVATNVARSAIRGTTWKHVK